MMTKWMAKGYLWLLLVLLYSPILIIMIFSFTEAKVLGNWTGFSTKLYSSLFTGGVQRSLVSALWNTFAIAMIAATVSTLLGSIAAIGIFNLRSRTRQVMNFANAIPMMNADIITGVSLFLLFVSFGFILAFTLSIDDFAVTIFTIGNEGLETLSTFIYADARKGGLTPELRPLSTIIFVTVLVLLIVINKRAEKSKS